MFVVDRTMEREQLKDVYIAGRDGVFDRLAALAGGESVGRSSPARFPIVSAEGIVWMNPQVIIDMSAGVAERNVDDRDVVRSWQAVAVVDAVRDGRVYAVRDDYAFIPGPRFILLVEKLARLIHPEVDWRQ